MVRGADHHEEDVSLVTPPIFVRADDLHIFDSVEEAESWMEPVDVEPGEVAYDAEGRLFHVVVRGVVKESGFSIDQSGARVELVRVEAQPGHAEDLRRVLVEWLGRVEQGADLNGASLAAMVERARSWNARQSTGVSPLAKTVIVAIGLTLLATGIWWARTP
jgi:hypothetical protein